MVLAVNTNQSSSGQRRACSNANIDNASMALMQCPSVLSAPTLMSHFYAYNAILKVLQTIKKENGVLAVNTNQSPSGQRRACSSSTSDNASMALMQ